MSYEEDYRRPYSAKCACGKGYLQFYRIYLSNDWGQEKENDTAVEIFCDVVRRSIITKEIMAMII